MSTKNGSPRSSRVYIAHPERLREMITNCDPETGEQGTISAFARRLIPDSSEDWEFLSDKYVRRTRPRRKEFKEQAVHKSTVERALAGKPILTNKAKVIAAELVTDLAGIGARPKPPKQPPRLPDPSSPRGHRRLDPSGPSRQREPRRIRLPWDRRAGASLGGFGQGSLGSSRAAMAVAGALPATLLSVLLILYLSDPSERPEETSVEVSEKELRETIFQRRSIHHPLSWPSRELPHFAESLREAGITIQVLPQPDWSEVEAILAEVSKAEEQTPRFADLKYLREIDMSEFVCRSINLQHLTFSTFSEAEISDYARACFGEKQI